MGLRAGARIVCNLGYMDVEVSDTEPSAIGKTRMENLVDKDRVRVKRKTLQAVLEQCQRALELLNSTSGVDDDDDSADDVDGENTDGDQSGESSGSLQGDREADEVCNFNLLGNR